MPFMTTVSLRFKPGTRQEFNRVYRDVFLPGRRQLLAQGDLLSTALILVGADPDGDDYLLVSQWASKEAHDRNEDNPHDVATQREASPYLSTPRSHREVRNPLLEARVRQILTYVTLAGMLGALFVGCLVALQWIPHTLGARFSDIALVGATLLVAVLFQPLRRRIRSEVDQRFYREHATTRAAAAEFQEALRHEVDPRQLFDSIITRAYDTMHPAFVSLWIMPMHQHVAERSSLPLGDEQIQVFGAQIVDILRAKPTVVA